VLPEKGLNLSQLVVTIYSSITQNFEVYPLNNLVKARVCSMRLVRAKRALALFLCN
jgi:hypothetical protein